jgi:uncharacterized phiE125 gp8 family phage protein
LRVDTATEDTLIAGLITTSRLQVEAILALALITQSWTWRLDHWPRKNTTLPIGPVASVATVRVQNADLSFTTVSPATYIVDGRATPPRLIPVGGFFPTPGTAALGIEIAFTAGYGPLATDVPAPLRAAVLQLTAHWFENREPVADGVPLVRFPEAVIGLMEPYRVRRL